jgi:hypothetical protein
MNKNYKNLVLAVLVIAIIYTMYDKYCDSPLNTLETYEDVQENNVVEQPTAVTTQEQQLPRSEVKPFEEGEENFNLNNPQDASIELGGCGNTGSFLSSNLLPKNNPEIQDNSEFAPNLEGKNFVDSYKYLIGSQSQSLRNANYQLRSDPPNPQIKVCPWQNTTMAPESRRPLEIGAGN